MAGLVQRIAAIVLAILVFTVAITALLAANTFKETLTTAIDAHYASVTENVRSIVDDGLNLGLGLEEVAAARNYMAREVAADPALRFVDVVDAEGVVRISTDLGAIGTPVPETWLGGGRGERDGLWRHADAEGAVLGVKLVSAFGAQVGMVTLGYSNARRDERLARATADMATTGAGVVLATSLIMVPLLTVFSRFPVRRVEALESALASVMGAAAGGRAPAIPRAEPVAAAALATLAATAAGIKAIGDEIDRLDQG